MVGVICDGLLYVANAGDSRMVLGRADKLVRGVMAIQLSTEHNVSEESVRDELRSLHPNDSQIVVLKHRVWRVKGIIQVVLYRPFFFNYDNTNRTKVLLYQKKSYFVIFSCN